MSKDRGVDLWIVSNLPPPVHGVSVFNEALVEECTRRGVTVRIFRVGSEEGSTIGRFGLWKAAREGLTIGRLAFNAAVTRGRSTRALYFTPSQCGPAVLRDAFVSLLGRLFFDRVVGHLHGCGWLEYQGRPGLLPKAMRYSLSGCDKVICLGQTFTNSMKDKTRLDCVPIDNGITGVTAGKRKTLPPPGAVLKLLFLGNFIRSKGLWVAAEATEELERLGIQAVLRCAGGWRAIKDREDFAKRFQRLLEHGSIELVGIADGALKEGLLRESHFLVFPTRYPFEGQPLVLIEALSAGLVPITTDQGGISDLMQFAGAEKLIHARHDTAQGIVETLRDLIANPQRYESLSERCIERYRTHLTFDRCADELLAVVGRANGV